MHFHHQKLFYLLLLLPGVPAVVAAQSIKRPPISGIAFVEWQTADLNKSASFYTGLLGYRIIKDKPAASKKSHSFTVSIGTRQSVKIFDGLPAGRDERLLSVAFQTTDAAAMLQYLRLNGIAVPQRIHTERNGLSWFAVTDPDGHPIKFVQYAANAIAQPKTVSPRGISARLLHAGLTIASAGTADKFYKEILGFSEIWRGGAADSITSWINMRVPEGTDYIEYMLVNGPVNRQQLGSLHHIALMVPDMQQALDVLNTRAAAAAYEIAAPRIGRNKRWQLNLFDPDGTRIELMEPFPMR